MSDSPHKSLKDLYHEELLRMIQVCMEQHETLEDKSGPRLGMSDLIMEECFLRAGEVDLEEWFNTREKGKGEGMTTERERELYFEARDRALTRLTDQMSLIRECREGFEAGVSAAAGGMSDLEIQTQILPKIQSESNFAFSFVCGFLARVESIKGKNYAASWQKRGEKDGALANLQRKFDRLENVMVSGDESGESVTETLGDGAVYNIKWLVLRAELNPIEFMAWLEEVRKL